jgi:hypothetical protein
MKISGISMLKVSLVKAVAVLISVFLFCSPAKAWHDETHIAVGKASGYAQWYNLAAADIVKTQIKSLGLADGEGQNHFYDAERPTSSQDVYAQVEKFGKDNDPEGHLLGAILYKVREYQKAVVSGKYGEYHLAIVGHYCGDLSQPLHLSRYDSFNKNTHSANDGLVERYGFLLISENIAAAPVSIDSEDDLVKAIVDVANASFALAQKIRAEHRLMTEQEAFGQLRLSVALFGGILRYVGKERDFCKDFSFSS